MRVKETVNRALTNSELSFVKMHIESQGKATRAISPPYLNDASKSSVARYLDDPEVRHFIKQIEKVKSALLSAQRILVVTGAGISAESGIPTFRSKGGWWRSSDPEQLATLAAFRENPGRVWEWYDYRRKLIAEAEPNLAHKTLAAWERHGKRVVIITQNVDDLHERAGSSQIIHIHGSIWHVKCLKDGRVYEDRRVPLPEIPPHCSGGGLMRPNVVWFDEELPAPECERIETFFKQGKVDLAFIIGTEATFDYVRGYALEGRRDGALLVEINLKPTPLTESVDIHLRGKAGEILPIL